jgi:hypothetical protein
MNRRSRIVKGLAAGSAATLTSGAGKVRAAESLPPGACPTAGFATSCWSTAPTPTRRLVTVFVWLTATAQR